MNAEATVCQFPALPKTVKAYTSKRAAKIAVTKAENAYELAVRNRCTDEWHSPRRWDDDNALSKRVNEYADQAYANLAATVAAATEQGFVVHSWHVGPNATRDLIAANMD